MFSLGQDREYYEKLRSLPYGLGAQVLKALNDVAADKELFARFSGKDVFQKSLMRNLPEFTVKKQFRRIIAGEVVLTPYRFSFERSSDTGEQPPFSIEFEVEPRGFPPTNMHVLIGPNGVGKSKLLRDFVSAIASPDSSTTGKFRDQSRSSTGEQDEFPFAGLVHVAFSAFEGDNPVKYVEDLTKDIKLVGLRGAKGETLEEQFTDSLRLCKFLPRRNRWLQAMSSLAAADSILRDSELLKLLDASYEEVSTTFADMSSGHKIVVLTMSRLVELVEEQTLVLLDEPETHLHPPLLSALVRAISDLIVERNGVAIIATHSPVVLQEVPRSCVYMLRRSGSDLKAWRLETESFGESVSRLTSEVFHLEVDLTGYHNVLKKLLAQHLGNADDVLSSIKGQLGSEGRFILNALAWGRSKDA